jgi:hypothetical protein
MTGNNVVALVIPPKQLTRSHRKTKYTVTFVPATQQWQWEVEFTHTTKHTGTALTQIKAFRSAEKFIDKMVGTPDAATA